MDSSAVAAVRVSAGVNHQGSGRWSRRTSLRTATILASGIVFAAWAGPAAAQDRVYNGPGGTWTDSGNWAGGNVADSASETAVFQNNAAPTTVNLGSNISLSGLRHDAGAQARTINLSSFMAMFGTGIVNNSGNIQTINVNGTQSSTSLQLAGSSDVTGTRTDINLTSGFVQIAQTANATNANIITGNNGVLSLETSDGTAAIGALSGSGTVITIQNNGAVANQVLTVGGLNLSTTFSGRITQNPGTTTGLNVAGTGTLTLTGNSNDYTGATTINSGATLRIGNGGTAGSIGSGQINFNGGTLTVNRSDTFTLSNVLAGATGNLVKDGAGTLVISNNNGRSGGTTTINAGQIRLTNLNGIGSTNLVFGGTGAIGTTSNNVINNVDIAAGASATFSAAPGATLFLTGNLTMQSAPGTAIRFGQAGQTGTVDFGFGGVGNLPNVGSASVDFGTLRLSNSSSSFFFLNLNGGLSIASGATYDINGQIGAGVNTTGGGTITNDGATANTFQAQQSGAGSTFSGQIRNGSATTNLLVRGGGTLTLTGVNTYTGTTTFAGGSTLQLGNGGTSGSLAGGSAVNLTNGTLAVNRSDSVTLANVLTGSGRLVQIGSGTTTLTGSNTFSGGSTINAGTLLAGSAGALGTGVVTFAGSGRVGTAPGNSATVNGVTVAAGQTATLSAAAGQTLTLTGTLDMAAAAGTQLRFGAAGQTGTVDFGFSSVGQVPNSGSTAVDAGTLRLLNGNAAFFFLNVNGGLTIASGATYDINGQIGAGVNLSGTGTITNNGASANIFQAQQTGTATFGGVIQNGGSTTGLLVRGGGTLVLTGANTYTGPTTFASNSTLQIGNGGATGSIGNGAVDLTNGHLVVNRSGALTLANTISGTGDLTLSGTGTTTLTGANTYSGATFLNQGTVQVGNTTALGTGTLTIAGGGATRTVRAIGNASLGNNIQVANGANATFSAAPGATLTVGGPAFQIDGNTAGTQIHFGSAGDTGTVVFAPQLGVVTGGNGYNVLVDGGTLRAGSNNTLTFLTSLQNVNTTVAAGATLDFSPFGSGNINNLLGAGTVLDNGSTTTVRGGNFGGDLAGTQALRVNGGTLVLTGANSYTGATSFTAGGTLQIGNGGATGSIGNGNIDLTNGHLVINRSGAYTLANTISGSGDLTLSGTGTTTVTGANSYTGATILQQGTVQVGSSNALGTGTLQLAGGGANRTVRGIADASLGNNVQVGNGANATFAAASGTTLTLNGGAFQIDASAAGTQVHFGSGIDNGTVVFAPQLGVVSGGAGYGLFIDGGTVRSGTNNTLTFFTSLNNANTNVAAGATLDFSPFGSGNINNLLGAGTVLDNGSTSTIRAGNFSGNLAGTQNIVVSGNASGGSLTLTGVNSYTGTTTVNAAGNLVLTGAGSIDSSSRLVANGSVAFNTAGDRIINLLTGSGFVTQAGSGRLTLNGTNTAGNDFTGLISANGGTVVVNGTVGDSTGLQADMVVVNGATLAGSGTFLGDVSVDNGSISPGNSPGTLTIAGNLSLTSASVLNFELSTPNVVGGGVNDLIQVGGNLTLDGTLNVTALPGFGAGYYRLISYNGTFTDNGLAFGTLPGGFTASLLTNVPGQVNILFGNGPGGQIVQYWDGFDTTGNQATPTGNGGPGTWNSTLTNWTVPPGWNFNDQWRGQVGVFAGTSGGPVTVVGSQSFQELRFQQNGYFLTGAGNLATTGGFSVIQVDPGLSADIDVAITGVGGLTKTGDGTLTLDANNSYTGVTTVAAGTLVNQGTIAGGVLNQATFNNFDTVNGLVVNNGTLNNLFGSLLGGLNNDGLANISGGQVVGAVNNSGTLLLSNGVTGIGAFTQTTSGNTAITGNTAFGSLAGAGTINIDLPILTVGSNNASTTFSGTIVGSIGQLTKVGTGTLTLTGANTYGGATNVNAGVLSIANASALGSTGGGTTVASGAALEIQGNISVGAENLNLSGTGIANGGVLRNVSGTNSIAGRIDLNGANVRFAADSGALTLSGLIVGTGNALSVGGSGNILLSGNVSGLASLTKDGSGFLGLSGSNLFTGPTFVNAGVLQTQGGASLSDTAGITVAPGAVWQLFSTEAVGSIAGSGQIALGSSILITGGDNSSTSFLGEISGTGRLVKTGTGTLTLGGANTYTGATTIDGGTLTVTGGAAIADTAAVVVNSAGTFNIGNTEAIGSLAGVAGSQVTLGSNILITGGNNSSTSFLGVISGTGRLVKVGTGTLTLGGANTYTGATTIDAGTLSLTGGAAIADSAAVLINTTGTLDLASSETIGSLTGLAGSQVTLNANTLTTGGNGDSTAFDGVISGAGGLTKVGAGTLVLGGANTYGGTTTISAGGLQIGNGGTTGSIGAGNIVDNGTFTIARSNAVTLANAISGTGALVQAGTGTTTLTGTNSYSGGTLVSAGRLVGNSSSLQGNIQDNAALEFNQTATGTFAGRIGGAGTLDKTGAGLLTLSGDNSLLTGATTVRAGELRVTSQLNNSATTVQSGAILSGNGTVGGLSVQSGGFVSPGAGATGIGTLGVNGNIALASGSTYTAQLLGPAGADLILGNGTATVGGTLALSNLGGTYAFNSTYLLLQAASRTGTFETLTGTTAFGAIFRPELVYTANQVLVRLAPNTLANLIGNQPLTFNERSVQQRVDAAVVAGYNPQPLIAIYSLPQAQIPAALDQLSGEVYAAAAGAGIEQERLVREAVLNRLSGTAAAARMDADTARGAGMWGQAFGSWGNVEGDGNASEADTDRTGFAVGIDVGGARENGSWRVGAFGQYVKTRVGVDLLGSRAEIEQTGGGLYAGFNAGGFSASLGGSYTQIDLSATRVIALPGFSETNRGEGDGEAYQGFAELSYAIPAGNWTLRPFISGHIGSFKLDGLTELGGASALSVGSQDYTDASGTAGINALVHAGRLRLSGTLGARAQLGDRDLRLPIALAAAPNQTFDIRGVQLDDLALSAQLEARLGIGRRVDLSLGYSGLIGETTRDHAVRGTVSIRF